MTNRYVLCTQGIKIFETNSQPEAKQIQEQMNHEYYEELQKSLDFDGSRFDNYVEIIVGDNREEFEFDE